MRRFAYWADGLSVACCALYALNRFGLQRLSGWTVSHGQIDDLLLIPCALPLVLWMHRRLGWRTHDGPPSAVETGLHLAVWSVVCEWLGPRWISSATADWRDVLAYTAGGLLAWLWWQRAAIFPAIFRAA